MEKEARIHSTHSSAQLTPTSRLANGSGGGGWVGGFRVLAVSPLRPSTACLHNLELTQCQATAAGGQHSAIRGPELVQCLPPTWSGFLEHKGGSTEVLLTVFAYVQCFASGQMALMVPLKMNLNKLLHHFSFFAFCFLRI